MTSAHAQRHVVQKRRGRDSNPGPVPTALARLPFLPLRVVTAAAAAARQTGARPTACPRQGAWLFGHRLPSASVGQAPACPLRGHRWPPASLSATEPFAGGARRKSRPRRAPRVAATATRANEEHAVADAGQWARAPGGRVRAVGRSGSCALRRSRRCRRRRRRCRHRYRGRAEPLAPRRRRPPAPEQTRARPPASR